MHPQSLEERTGAVTFKGNPMTLLGRELKVGDTAPELQLTGADLSVKNLDAVLDGGAAMLIVVPSLDTGVCSLESKKFNDRIGELPPGVHAYVVSMDLPFAMGRWAGEEDASALGLLSDYRNHRFGNDYGLRIKELGLLARAIVVIGKDKKIRYTELIHEVADEPNYDAAIAAAKSAAA